MPRNGGCGLPANGEIVEHWPIMAGEVRSNARCLKRQHVLRARGRLMEACLPAYVWRALHIVACRQKHQHLLDMSQT